MSVKYTLTFNKERVVDNETQVLYSGELEVFEDEDAVREWIDSPESVFNTTRILKQILIRSIASR